MKMYLTYTCSELRGGGDETRKMYSAGIVKQSMGARNQVGIGLSYETRQAAQPGGIGSSESILKAP